MKVNRPGSIRYLMGLLPPSMKEHLAGSRCWVFDLCKFSGALTSSILRASSIPLKYVPAQGARLQGTSALSLCEQTQEAWVACPTSPLEVRRRVQGDVEAHDAAIAMGLELRLSSGCIIPALHSWTYVHVISPACSPAATASSQRPTYFTTKASTTRSALGSGRQDLKL